MKSSQIKVSQLGEKQLIERIIQKSKSCSIYKPSNFNDFDIKTSIGDDSALTNVNIDDNSYLVSSSDMLIQSSHFPKAMTHFQMRSSKSSSNVSFGIARFNKNPIFSAPMLARSLTLTTTDLCPI